MIIYAEKGGPFSWLLERISGRDELEEMATLKKTVTGLPVNIWVDETKSYTLGGHAKRIKFQGDYGNNTNRGNLFTMIISKGEPQIPAGQLPKVKLPSKDIEAIKTFVRNNADLLDKLADEKIDIVSFLRQMRTS
jgi:hypothetical protein